MRTMQTELDKPLVKVTVLTPEGAALSWNLDASEPPAWASFARGLCDGGNAVFVMVVDDDGHTLFRWADGLGEWNDFPGLGGVI